MADPLPAAAPTDGAESDAGAERGARAAAVGALVDAATRLFADHGPDGVPLRAVAAEAGVNYGLIHQYVGSKDDLVRLVCRSVSERTAREVAAEDDLDATVERMFGHGRTDYVTMLTWTLLQGRDPVDLLGRSPALTAVTETLDPALDDADARVAAMTAMALGWQVFGPFVAAGLGADDGDRDRIDREVRRLARRLLGDDPESASDGVALSGRRDGAG